MLGGTEGGGGRGVKHNCVLVCQVALWCNGQHSGLSHQRPGFQFRRNRVKSNSAAATAAVTSRCDKVLWKKWPILRVYH